MALDGIIACSSVTVPVPETRVLFTVCLLRALVRIVVAQVSRQTEWLTYLEGRGSAHAGLVRLQVGSRPIPGTKPKGGKPEARERPPESKLGLRLQVFMLVLGGWTPTEVEEPYRLSHR